MKISKILFLILSLIAIKSFANEGDDLASIQNIELNNAAKQYQSTVQGIYHDQGINSTSYQDVVQTLGQNATNAVMAGSAQQNNQAQADSDEGKEAKGVMVFVSLGMPPEVLRQIFMEANTLQIPVVVRGALNNNFKESAQVLFSILHPANQSPIKGGVEVDPKWFKEFNIKQVPAVVAISNANPCFGESCPTPPYDIVYGNIPIAKALKEIVDNGDAAPQVAAKCLSNLGDQANAY